MNQVLYSCFFLVISLTFSQAAICQGGKSPIALDPTTAIAPAAGKSLEFMYERSVMNFSMVIEDNTVVGKAGVDSAFAEFLMLDGTKYMVKQMRLRWGCTTDDGTEHSICGVKYGGEIQLEHTKSGNGKGPEMVIVSIPVEQADAGSEETRQLYTFIKDADLTIANPIETQLSATGASMKSFLKGSVLKYIGTNTMGNCNKKVAWLVFKQPIQAVSNYFTTLRALKKENTLPMKESALKTIVTKKTTPEVVEYETFTLLAKPVAL